MESMTRGHGWRFLDMGRKIERTAHTVGLLHWTLTPTPAPGAKEETGHAPWESNLLDALLEIADSSMTYRARYYTTLQPLAVLDVLMADETNPRSLDFQLSHLADLYQKLPRHLPVDLKAMRGALALLRSFDLRKLKYPLPGVAATNASDGLSRLANFLLELGRLLPSWSNNLSSRYFSHARTLPITIGQ